MRRPVLLRAGAASTAHAKTLTELMALAADTDGSAVTSLLILKPAADAAELPGSGDTLALWELLATLGAADLTAARVVEPHLDAQAILALVSPSFHDDLGTRTPLDDVNRATLERDLPQKLAALTDVNVDISLREITFDGPRAYAVFYFDTSYRIPKIQEPQRADSDLARMELAREDGKWKIIRGL